MNIRKIIKKFVKSKPSAAYQKIKGLEQPFKNSGIWGCGWLPSPLYHYRTARDLADYYGMTIKYEGGLSENGVWMNWYAWYPEERFKSDPKWIPYGMGQGISLGEAVVRCLLDCLNQGILGDEKFGPL